MFMPETAQPEPVAPEARPEPAAAEPAPVPPEVIDGPGPLVEPPEAFLNGVPGDPVSWCGWGACADGFVGDATFLPVVKPPWTILLPDGARIESVTAHRSRDAPAVPGNPPGQGSTAVELRGSEIVEVPPDAEWVCVFARWPMGAEGSDASYCWALPDPASEGS